MKLLSDRGVTLKAIEADLRPTRLRDKLSLSTKIPDNSVDVIVTSPPYKKKDGYSRQVMVAFGMLAGRVLKPGGRLFMNFGQLKPEGFETPYEARTAVKESSGLETGQTIAWVKSVAVPTWKEVVQEIVDKYKKSFSSPVAFGVFMGELRKALKGPGRVLSRGHYTPITLRSPVLNYVWEPVFQFFKPPQGPTDRLSIGVEFADKSNMKRGTRGKHGDLHCAGDAWWIPYETTGHRKKKATARDENAYEYPEELVERCLKYAAVQPGDTVLDPFCGSGTTAGVAKRLGIHAIAVDVRRSAIKATCARWQAEKPRWRWNERKGVFEPLKKCTHIRQEKP